MCAASGRRGALGLGPREKARGFFMQRARASSRGGFFFLSDAVMFLCERELAGLAAWSALFCKRGFFVGIRNKFEKASFRMQLVNKFQAL